MTITATTPAPAGGSAPRPVSRRSFLGRSAVVGSAVVLPAWLLSACGGAESTAGSGASAEGSTGAEAAADITSIKATHGTGLCNLGFFLVKERSLAEADGVELDFVVTPTNADIATLFGSGQVEASLIPYSNFLTLYDAGAPVTIVAGGGVEGCAIVAQPGIETAADLVGKSLGTFQADTLEVLPFSWMEANGQAFSDLDVRYFGTSPELAQAFISGAIDSMCHIEPYATQALAAVEGAVKLSDGTDVYGDGYSDCVLAVQNKLLVAKPAAAKAVIKALMVAQQQAEEDREAAVDATVGTYYKADKADVLDASTKQPNVVDQRGQTQFILDGGEVLRSLGYLDELPDEDAFDYTLLEEVIEENADLYESLEIRST